MSESENTTVDLSPLKNIRATVDISGVFCSVLDTSRVLHLASRLGIEVMTRAKLLLESPQEELDYSAVTLYRERGKSMPRIFGSHACAEKTRADYLDTDPGGVEYVFCSVEDLIALLESCFIAEGPGGEDTPEEDLYVEAKVPKDGSPVEVKKDGKIYTVKCTGESVDWESALKNKDAILVIDKLGKIHVAYRTITMTWGGYTKSTLCINGQSHNTEFLEASYVPATEEEVIKYFFKKEV